MLNNFSFMIKFRILLCASKNSYFLKISFNSKVYFICQREKYEASVTSLRIHSPGGHKQLLVLFVGPRSQTGCKADGRKTICHCINIIVIKLRHSQNSTERIAISESSVSDLLESRDSYLQECLNSICYHLRAVTKIWQTVHMRKTQ